MKRKRDETLGKLVVILKRKCPNKKLGDILSVFSSKIFIEFFVY